MSTDTLGPPSFMRACHSTLMRTDAADLYILEMTDNLSDGYEGVGKSVEGLMSAVRQRAPHAALILLAPIPQRCVRSLKRMKPFQHVPLDDDSTRMLLQRDCYSNDSVAASFEDVGRAHDIPTVSARLLIRDQLWRNPAMAGHIISKLHYDAVHRAGWPLAARSGPRLCYTRLPVWEREFGKSGCSSHIPEDEVVPSAKPW